MSEAQFTVGIDLGTTHCVMAFATISDDGEPQPQQLFTIPQLVGPGQIEERNALPSFAYLPHESELPPSQRQLPWGEFPYVAGQLARELGAKTPTRLVSSAKSWLGHGEVDRRSGLLPLQAPEDVSKLSPYEVSKHYLQHLTRAWDQRHPDAPLAKQQLTITVPASFDPSARELTALAALEVGLHQATLLEEPQAALYSWISGSHGDWRNQVSTGDVILVIDLGGGTTDLSLIAVTEEDGALALNRIAVGDHLLLGGDNMDLALAHTVRQKLAQQGTQLQPWQLLALSHGCRQAKETLFSQPELTEVPIVVPSRGSSLIGGSLRTELSRAEVDAVLVEGFFPRTDIETPVVHRARGALTKLNLPYAQDPAVTRHLAAFLSKQRHATDELSDVQLPAGARFLHPTAVLFNGGVVKASPLTNRIVEVLNQWLTDDGAAPVKVLAGNDPDQAVAHGAAYYGSVRSGNGVRIRGGIASAYYVGIESAMPAVPGMEAPIEAFCIAPFGMEEGTEASLPTQEFGLVVGQPVRFRFFSSTVRRDDQPGHILDFWNEGELEELPAIEALLPAEGRTPGDVVPVLLQASINALGTLELAAMPIDGSEHWQVEFDTRGESA
ncbi:Hsp70 family protein [Corallincola luteus]|uniref:Hsp70 family protein n=1 Tax=Corallincola luteus TaxID=1775177 RepID=A0ABY2AQF1_9GAMM|nr:Hsp70 family protein [Corallincola luteus]TCI05154.1 Hsp70 family protein [Corallincola luteus]